MYAISVQNEPDIQVQYESCDWNSVQFIDWLTREGSKFDGTRLIVAESFHFDHSLRGCASRRGAPISDAGQPDTAVDAAAPIQQCDRIPPSSDDCSQPLAPGDHRKCTIVDIVDATKDTANIDPDKVYMPGISSGSLISFEIKGTMAG